MLQRTHLRLPCVKLALRYFVRRFECGRLLWAGRVAGRLHGFRRHGRGHHRGHGLCAVGVRRTLHPLQVHQIAGAKSTRSNNINALPTRYRLPCLPFHSSDLGAENPFWTLKHSNAVLLEYLIRIVRERNAGVLNFFQKYFILCKI